MQTKTGAERRKSPRYRCRDDKEAFVALRPSFKKVGKVKDVSVTGLGFQYTLMDEQEEPLSFGERNVSIDLFVSNNGFYLPDLKCQLAYDRANEPLSPFSFHVKFRQSGLEFDFAQMSDEQKEMIKLFLRDYTAGEA